MWLNWWKTLTNEALSKSPVIIQLIKQQNKLITKPKDQLFDVYSSHYPKCKEQFREFSIKALLLRVAQSLLSSFTFTGREKLRFQYQATDAESIK